MTISTTAGTVDGKELPMCSRMFLTMALLLVTCTAGLGQNSAEYSRLPIVPPKAPNPAAKLVSRVGDQNSSPQKSSIIEVPNNESNNESKTASQITRQGAQPTAAATPKSAAIFILSNGERLESNNYTLTHDSVQLMQNGVQRTIRLSSVDVQATLAANKQRGIDLKIPADKSQMTLSF